VRPGGLHCGVGGQRPHLGEGRLGEVLMNRVEEPPHRLAARAVGGACGELTRDGLAGLKVSLVSEDELAVVTMQESGDHRTGLVASTGKNVSSLQQKMTGGHFGDLSCQDSTIENGPENGVVGELGHLEVVA